ncbi:MAG: hypothetical protein IPM71_14095 [Bacteroidota bacterium]|nr:MAG: hypothetical protein IPM71_14095 [Bacteroidota bacterium]
MKIKLLALLLLFLPAGIFAQGFGVGYQLDFGLRTNFGEGSGYDQTMNTFIQSLYLRVHDESGKQAYQISLGLRVDSMGFINNNYYYSADQDALEQYHVDAHLKRLAWRLGYTKQLQFAGEPGKFVLAFNYGFVYENTIKMKRESIYDEICYNLYDEFNKHNFGLSLGIEMRIWYVTFGYKYEYMFVDVMNHEVLKQSTSGVDQNAELKGIKYLPSTSLFYLAFHFDAFHKQE